MKKTLSNGLRVVTVPMEGVETVTAMVLVRAGTNYESKAQHGVAHFLEHMFFRGTKRRPTSFEVTKAIDEIGGRSNAMTSREYVGYYVQLRAEHTNTALDWLSDILLNSTFPKEAMEKEKGVVLEEIRMYKDSPREQIYSEWIKLLYGDQSAGRPGLGTEDMVKSFKRSDVKGYIDNHYSAQNSIVVLAGKVSDLDLEQFFGSYSKKDVETELSVQESQTEPSIALNTKETEQAHLYLGVRGVSLLDDEEWTQRVISSLLGGMMSSRLSMAIRDQLGLAYYIYAFDVTRTQYGSLIAGMGVDKNRVDTAIKTTLDNYKLLTEKLVSKEELKRSKENIKGRMALQLEDSSQQALFYGEQELLEGQILTPQEIFKEIDAVTREDVLRFSKEIFRPEGLNLAIIGPYDNEDRFKKLLNDF